MSGIKKGNGSKLFLGVVMLALCVVLFLERLTGSVIHSILGVLLVVIATVHLCRRNAKMQYRSRAIRNIDLALIVLMAVLLISGVLLHPLNGVLALKIVHKLAAALFVVGVIAHIVQHRRTKVKK